MEQNLPEFMLMVSCLEIASLLHNQYLPTKGLWKTCRTPRSFMQSLKARKYLKPPRGQDQSVQQQVITDPGQ
jgi:hypothetical protein